VSFLLDIEQNVPPPIILGVSASLSVPVHRVGNFYEQKTGAGCSRTCIWNGGGYYMDMFVCGQTYPSGLTFYCSSDCHHEVGKSQKVFLSYRWCDADIAEKIASYARGAGIDVLRDVNKMGFLDAISSFMDTAGESRYFVAVMTESYFYSRFCMYELCQLAKSEEPIRTIPVMLGAAAEPGIESTLSKYWRDKHQELAQAIRGIDKQYTTYLQPELDLLASIPAYLGNFYALWRAKERPEGKRWLLANCRYLVGAIKTTFKPTEDDATNWTYSNPTVRGERAEDAPLATWEPQPFYLHACSEVEAHTITRITKIQQLLLGVYLDGLPSQGLLSGSHVALISVPALSSLTFCTRLQHLLERDDVTVVPMFLDKALQMPGTELDVLRQWYNRLKSTASRTTRDEIDLMLRRFGPMVEHLRDTLAPSADVVFGE
jgi:hypothetical protein